MYLFLTLNPNTLSKDLGEIMLDNNLCDIMHIPIGPTEIGGDNEVNIPINID